MSLVLLAIVLAACRLCNWLVPNAALNAPHVFAALAFAALLLDAALTFLVFADAQNRYGRFSAPAAFFERVGAYAFAAAIALALGYAARREQPAKAKAHDMLAMRITDRNGPCVCASRRL
ncbi:hypothetical protein [Paraburkholderia lacunae]|uniref:hypothetical protein n=1 Tax=Paraburkholderia lacunae TaxID=2211104 RepID=UPI001AD8367F